MNRKSMLAILTCLMMFSSLAGGLLLIPTQAQLPTPPTITLWVMRANNPDWGYYGGYWPMWEVIKPELLKIGINVKFVDLDPFEFEAQFYDNWNISGDPDGDGTRDGWDLTTREWWLNPTSHIWFDEMVLADHVPEWNISPYMDEEADVNFLRAVSALKYNPTTETWVRDVDTYMTAMKYWQEEFMHNPPFIGVYYQKIMTATTAYVDGYDPGLSWFYNPRELRINRTIWDSLAGDGLITDTRLAQGPDVLVFGTSEPISTWDPYLTLYYTEEMINVITNGMLYRNEVEHMNFPAHGNARVYPDLLTDYIEWLDASAIYPADYPESVYPDYLVARLKVRPGVYWSDGVELNATDIAFSLEYLKEGSNYRHIIAEARENSTYVVDLVTYGPRYELEGLFAHGWAFYIVPYHQVVKWGITEPAGLDALDAHPSALDPKPESAGGQGLERLGPYIPVYADIPSAPTAVELQRFDVYVGPDGARLDTNPETGEPYPATPWYWNNTIIDYDLSTPEPDGIGDNAGEKWGWGLPKYLLVKLIPEGTDRFLALQAMECDLIDYPAATKEDWLGLDPTKFKVYTEGAPYPAIHPVWFNLNNPILSNRYVRLAIAHAIPYEKIFTEVLPSWGVAEAIPGRTYVHPWMEAFDPTIDPFFYDIELAKEYMWMFWNSLDETTWNKYTTAPYAANAADGPVGDHDLSGFVELADFRTWVKRLGSTPSNYYQYTYPFPATFPELIDRHVYWPGNDVDPDNDNNDFVEVLDFFDWRDNTGVYYP